MWHIGDGMGWWMVYGTLFELVIIVAVIVLVAKYVGAPPNDRTSSDPLDIARHRYASGEIRREEYEQLRRDLTDEHAGVS